MNATAKGGKKSKIVPKVEMVTALRTDVDIVVTEFGVARIKDLPVKERGRALVEIAAPEFRDELLADPYSISPSWERKKVYSSASS